jgi:GNAT superfamily N-acetyltransferase
MNTIPNILIRIAQPKDLLETVHIYLECIRGDYACKPAGHLAAKNVSDELAECKEWLYASDRPNRVYVAMDGTMMAGYIAVGPNTGQPSDHEGEVCGFFVRKSYRKNGIGLRLLKAGITYLRDLGYQQVAIYNYRISEANLFYRRLRGKVVWQEIQTPGGMPLETDVFGYEITTLLSTINQRLTGYGLLKGTRHDPSSQA